MKIDFSNYVNSRVLFQYNDEKVLHLVVFYSRNMISIECNYEIYDKKLLVIIRCLKHWCSKLESIEKLIKIFIDYKNLESFMTSKKLISRQIRWAEIFSKFNIVIQFQFETQNVKTNILIRMFDSRFKNDIDERHQYRKQILFISKRFEIHAIKFDESIYERIFVVNRIDDDCTTYREIIEQNFNSMNEIDLRNCIEKNDALYQDDWLWMFVDVFLLIDFFREIYEFLVSNHSKFNRLKNFLRRDYYWFNMRKIVRRYVRNCHDCQRIKVFKNRKNDLFILLIIFLQRWIDISINFIIELFDAHDHNVICTIIDKLSKKRHYVFCTIDDENINVEITIKILINYVFRTYELLFFITSNRNLKFILFVWQAFCKILDIKCKFFIVFHSKIDEQIEKINQDIEKQLQQYCNYMQNDWDVWLFMIEFANNNAIFTTIELSFFFVNKKFHSRMNFSSNFISYVITKKRLLIVKAKNIIKTMQNIFNYVRNNCQKADAWN